MKHMGMEGSAGMHTIALMTRERGSEGVKLGTINVLEWEGYLKAAPTAAPPARAGAQQHTEPSSADFFVAAM